MARSGLWLLLCDYSGVYALANSCNGKVYVGSACNLYERRKQHYKLLAIGKHYNSHLQSAYSLYGETAFDFVVLEYTRKEDLLTCEQYWIDLLCATNPEWGYNVRKLAHSNLGRTYTSEQRARMGKSHIGNKNVAGKKQSKETIEKRVSKLRGQKRRISEAGKNSEKMRAFRKRHAEMMRGRKHDWHSTLTPETRAKLSISMKAARAKNLKTYDGFIDPNGIPVGPIRGLIDFCREHDLSSQNMSAVYLGKRKSHHGYTMREAI